MIKSTPTDQKAPFEFLNDAPELRRYWDARLKPGAKFDAVIQDGSARAFCDSKETASAIRLIAMSNRIGVPDGEPVEVTREECNKIAREEGATTVEIAGHVSGQLGVVERWPV